MSITHNKNLNPLSNLLVDCTSAKSASQILSLNGEYNFLCLNFIITYIRRSEANWQFCGIDLTPLPEVFLSKNL